MTLRKMLFLTAWVAVAWAIWPLPWWRFLVATLSMAAIGVLALFALDDLLSEMEKEI